MNKKPCTSNTRCNFDARLCTTDAVHPTSVRRSLSRRQWLPKVQHDSAQLPCSASRPPGIGQRRQQEGTLTQVRFMLVSAPASSMVRWPGGWFAQAHTPTPHMSMWCAWRLLSANNRELGRSYKTFPDSTACSEAVALLTTRIGDAEAAIIAGLRTGLWHWEVSVNATPIAISPRSFTRQRECEHNLEQFLAVVNAVRKDAVAVTESVS